MLDQLPTPCPGERALIAGSAILGWRVVALTTPTGLGPWGWELVSESAAYHKLFR
jgi:hypothetical protein